MGLEIYFSEDIRNALLAANEASSATAAVAAEVSGPICQHQLTTNNGHFHCTVCWREWTLQEVYDCLREYEYALASNLRAYREGYKAALSTIALAFGLVPQRDLTSLPECDTIPVQ